ncbi:MAG: PAS domain S-box protein [Candidatus Riflebacteria bacterium]|nr:PAS domain S-box protein [Candidatus Riflebacteria bacterium]
MQDNASYEDLLKRIHELEGVEKELVQTKEELLDLEMIFKKGLQSSEEKERFVPNYGNLTDINQNRLILESVGEIVLNNIVLDFLELLETSSAVYELNGDYAIGIFSSGWCQFLDRASRKLCDTDDNKEALSCGKWICHESCWKKASKVAIETGAPVDVECDGGLFLYTLPIKAGDQIIGSINFAHGNPPTDETTLQKIAAKYDAPIEKLRELANAYKPRPPFIIELAKKRLEMGATLIGEIVHRKKLEEDYRMLFLQMLDGFALHEIICNENGIPVDYRFLRVNQTFERMTGLKATDIEGKTVREVLPATEPYWIEAYGKVALTGEAIFFENFSSELNKHFEVKAYRPAPNQFACIIMDVTERKRTELALKEEKERLMVTLQSIGDGVITTDTAGRVVIINKVAEKLTGWNQTDAFGKSINVIFNIINAGTRQKCENPVEKVLEVKVVIGLANDTTLVSRDGTERMIADSGAPIFDANSEIIGVVLVFRDISEKYRMEKEMQQIQKLESIGTLAGGIAHDFNNLLGAITGNISYALSRVSKNEEIYEVLSDTLGSTKQAQTLTQQLLTFSKGGTPVKKISNINQIIRETALFVARGGNIRCEFELPDDLWSAEVDPGQINQAISNLVINANQAMPEGGIVKLKSENFEIASENLLPLPPGKYIKISVQDHGIGISERHISKIFDPYFSTKQKGSGLGLAIVYSIIKRHNGYIEVNSTVGKGSIFFVYLPASSVVHVNIEQIETTHNGRGKILIMDDQEAILKMTGRILNGMGYETVFASDGSQAIEIYRKAYQSAKPFDLVILDLTVPGAMGGAKTIPELLKIDSNVKAVVSSGYSNDPIMANYKDYGFSGVISKPYTRAQLAEILNTILENKS